MKRYLKAYSIMIINPVLRIAFFQFTIISTLLLSGHNTFADEYIAGDFIPDSLYVLPSPPDKNSSAFMNDKNLYIPPKKGMKTPQWRDAQQTVDLNDINALFANATGLDLDKKHMPKTYNLLESLVPLVADKGTRKAKEFYHRERPFVYFHQQTCSPEQENDLRNNGSYPSGHAATGWALALVLADIMPERRNEILKRGYEIGQLRVVCGVHWQSDVDAGRLVGAAIYSALNQSESFKRDLNKARDEIHQLIAGRKWYSNVYAPTFIDYIDGKWVLVDCWNSRILWNNELTPDLSNWQVLEDRFSSHSVAYDGHKYWATEDTEHGRIVFYTFYNGKFHQASDLNNLGTRTHRLRYDSHSNSFMLISATSGDFWRIQIVDNKPKIIQHINLKKYLTPQSKDFEIRSFTQHNGMLYFVSSLATPEILIVKDDSDLTMVKKIPVPSDLSNMQEIYFFPDGKVFISSDYKKVVLLNSIEDISHAKNQYDKFSFLGSPYWISKWANHYFITELGYKNGDINNLGLNGVSEWSYSNGKLKKLKEVVRFTSPTDSNVQKKSEIRFQI
ncbi:phosphatase PAP2 family protein [Salmonella enterica]|nr:phosphatase PAP2 family protein [Salmonella enterica]